MDEDGSVVMAGSAGDDFQVIRLDADGSLVWRFEVYIYYPFPRMIPRYYHWKLYVMGLPLDIA